jgi:precorrin-2/cobalt-factor-2 C20-methyltransferase
MTGENVEKGKFVGVGIGPGDPELLTLKAVATLELADVICTPRSENSEDSVAYAIVKQFCTKKTVIDMSFSMAPVHADRSEFWMRHARIIVDLCDAGKTVAFVTLGDPGLFSSFGYVVRLVREIRPATKIEVVPGITSIAATTAALGISLAQAEEGITIQPCSRVLDKDERWWKSFDCVVVMKIGKRLPLLIRRLDNLSLIDHASLVKRAGFSDMSIIKGAVLLDCATEPGYLATLIVRAGGRKNQEGAD